MTKGNPRTEAAHSRESPTRRSKQPEPPMKGFGELVGRYRQKRGWSRRRFVFILHDTMSKDDPNYNKISESWLARLENGQVRKQLPTSTLDSICCALGCEGKERTDLLLYADRNVLTNPGKRPSFVAEVLNYVMHRVDQEAHEILATIIAQRGSQDLDELELLEITRDTLSLLLDKHGST